MTQDAILEHILEAEGGFVDHPLDRGGPTNLGVTLKSYEAYKRRPVTVQELKELTRAEAKAFYLQEFWRPLGLDHNPSWRMRLCLMDYGVNRGVSRALKNLETIAGEADVKAAVKYMFRAQRAYCEIVKLKPEQAVFLKGWLNRTQRVLGAILQLEG